MFLMFPYPLYVVIVYPLFGAGVASVLVLAVRRVTSGGSWSLAFGWYEGLLWRTNHQRAVLATIISCWVLVIAMTRPYGPSLFPLLAERYYNWYAIMDVARYHIEVHTSGEDEAKSKEAARRAATLAELNEAGKQLSAELSSWIPFVVCWILWFLSVVWVKRALGKVIL